MSEFANRFHASFARVMKRTEEYNGQLLFCDIEDLCDSEIEKMLAAELLDLFCPTNPIHSHMWRERNLQLSDVQKKFDLWLEDSGCYDAYGPRPRVCIFPQVRIGRFRVDFLIMADDSAIDTNRTMLVIECDGHDFHERTKQQASRDRSRDRALTASNIPFLRFTGSEIYRDSKACMLEVEQCLWKAMFGRECRLREYDED